MNLASIVTFIGNQRRIGKTNEQISASLTKAGWDSVSIQQAFDAADSQVPLPESQTPVDRVADSSHKENSLWSIFQNILTFISLAFFASSLHILWSLYFDFWFPSKGSTGESSYTYIINSSLSSLIISAPIFIGLFLMTNNKYVRQPDLKKKMGKKYLNYFILIITFVILLSRLAGVVSSALDNSFTVNTGLGLLVTICIVGSIFAYYLYEVRIEKQVARLWTYIAIVIFLSVLSIGTGVLAFYVRGNVQKIPKYPVMSNILPAPTPIQTYVIASSNTSVQLGQISGIDVTLNDAQITKMLNEFTLILDVTLAANVPCPLTGGTVCGGGGIGVKVTDIDGFILEKTMMNAPDALKDTILKQGEKVRGKVYFTLKKPLDKLSVSYHDPAGNNTPIVLVSMTMLSKPSPVGDN